MSFPTRLVFGLAMPESLAAPDAGVGSLIRWLGTQAGVELVRFQVPSYEALAQQMTDGAIQVAWLPPLVFVRLEREGVVVPLVTNQRTGSGGYQSVLLVRGASTIHTLDGLRGASAAWVDPLSASGYVLPRIQLAALGLDPRTLFAQERFYGSHPAAVAALLDGSADVAATFAGLNASGGVTSDGWTEQASNDDDVRVLATFGLIPGDLIAVRQDVAVEVRAALAGAFLAVCNDETMGPMARRLFGVEAFSTRGFASYDPLRRTVDAAAERGLMEIAVIHSSRLPTRPPPAPG